MTAKLNPLSAAPSLMKEWHRTSIPSPEGSFHAGRAGQAHIANQYHQRVEPHRCWLQWLGRSGRHKSRCQGGGCLMMNVRSEAPAR
jgi:hypothetical protein